MSHLVKYFLCTCWFGGTLICAMLLFSKGFFLIKKPLSYHSSFKSQIKMEFCDIILNFTSSTEIKGEKVLQCTDMHQPLLSNQLDVKLDSSQYCFKNDVKVILLIVDALRFDFIDFNENPYSSSTPHFRNKLTVIKDLIKSSPKRAKLLRFIADPPTYTTQRLNGLSTGSLPTFKDIESNLDTHEITEDNIIDQLVKGKKNITLMGDATLSLMYPGRFKRQYPYPSFALWDLDSTDTNIKKKLFLEMQENDWDLIIAHFAGIDHCGHYFGPEHSEMTRKLLELNEVLNNVINKIDNNTMLFVIGDHGMTSNGNHGGGSELEITSALFVYSPWPFISNGKPAKKVRQVDLVPTLASIMGVPIPFSNVGSIIVDILPSFGSKPNAHSNWVFILANLWTNLKQITLYIQEYEKAKSQFSPEELGEIRNSFQKLRADIKNIYNEEELTRFIGNFYTFTNRIGKMCEKAWTQINIYIMLGGLFTCFILLSSALSLIGCLPVQCLDKVVETISTNILYPTLILTAITLFILKCSGFFFDIELSCYLCVCMISTIFLILIVTTKLKILPNKYSLSSEKLTTIFILTRTIALISMIGYFSNSYLVNESFSSLFLFIAFISTCVLNVKGISNENTQTVEFHFWSFLKSFFQSPRGRAITLSLVLFALMRVSLNYVVCRPEQTCAQETPMFSDIASCILSISLLTIFTIIALVYLRRAEKLVGFSFSILISCFASAVVLLTSVYWILKMFSQHKRVILEPYQLTLLPCIALSILLVTFLIFFCSLCISLPDYASLFCHLQANVSLLSNTEVNNYSVATAHSIPFINLSLFLTLLAALVLGYQQGAIAVFLTTSLWIIAAISSLLPRVPSWGAVAWGLSCQHFFFTTGHQATFSSIDWNSASLLSSDSTLTSPVVSAILVLGNVFSAHILHAALLPLLILVPNIISKHETPLGVTQSEIILEDCQGNQTMFKLCVEYLIFFGLRVFVCMLVVFWQARHIMVWEIFAPKFIFEGIAFIITLPAMLMGLFIFIRITKKFY